MHTFFCSIGQRPRSCLLLICLTLTLQTPWGLAQEPPEAKAAPHATNAPTAKDAPGSAATGYLEGRILSLQRQPAARSSHPQRAQVRLSDGRVILADVPPLLQPQAGTGPDYRVGERVEIYYSPGPDGTRNFVVSDWLRRTPLYVLAGLFLLIAALVGGFKGLRAVLATSLSLAIAIAFVVPQILAGQPPTLIALVGVGGMLMLAVYFVHGISWSTTAALIGTLFAVGVTMFLGVIFADAAHLSGYGSEEAMMISLDATHVNLLGLFLAGVLIGALGALTDVTIVQAALVREFAFVNPGLSWRGLYALGMRVGKDHIGSLVNTLVLAYAGSSLPLLLLLNLNNFSLGRALNTETVAAEVVHTLVGSIGLMLAVPLTTLFAALLFKGDRLPVQKGEFTLGHAHGANEGAMARYLQQQRQLELLAELSPDAAAEALQKRLKVAQKGSATGLRKGGVAKEDRVVKEDDEVLRRDDAR